RLRFDRRLEGRAGPRLGCQGRRNPLRLRRNLAERLGLLGIHLMGLQQGRRQPAPHLRCPEGRGQGRLPVRGQARRPHLASRSRRHLRRRRTDVRCWLTDFGNLEAQLQLDGQRHLHPRSLISFNDSSPIDSTVLESGGELSYAREPSPIIAEARLVSTVNGAFDGSARAVLGWTETEVSV